MERIYNKIDIGADAPFNLLHVTDIHIACPDNTDDEEIIQLAQKRKTVYPFSERVLSDTGVIANEEKAIPVITGDIMDCFSHGSALRIKQFTDRTKCLFIAGNHDFRVAGGMKYDVPSSREKNLKAVNSLFENDIRFFSKIVNGVNIVGIDNAYYRFEEYQFERLKAEIEKGFPVILAMHVPLYTQECYDLMITEKRRFASLICVPEDKMKIYPPERYIQQKEDRITREMYDYILSQSLIKLVICGHVHKNFESTLPSGAPQLITGTDTARVIRIK